DHEPAVRGVSASAHGGEQRVLRDEVVGPEHGLAGGGVHDVEPAGLAGLGDVAPPVQVEQDRRADRGEVPDVVGHGLEVPAQGAGLAVQGDDGGRVQVVAGPHPPVEAGRRVADAEVEGLGGGVVGGG